MNYIKLLKNKFRKQRLSDEQIHKDIDKILDESL